MPNALFELYYLNKINQANSEQKFPFVHFFYTRELFLYSYTYFNKNLQNKLNQISYKYYEFPGQVKHTSLCSVQIFTIYHIL